MYRDLQTDSINMRILSYAAVPNITQHIDTLPEQEPMPEREPVPGEVKNYSYENTLKEQFGGYYL